MTTLLEISQEYRNVQIGIFKYAPSIQGSWSAILYNALREIEILFPDFRADLLLIDEFNKKVSFKFIYKGRSKKVTIDFNKGVSANKVCDKIKAKLY